MDEHTFGLDGDSLVVGEVTDGVGLHAIRVGNRGFGLQPTQSGGPHIAEADRPGQTWIDAIAGRFPQQVIEHECGHTAMDVAWWSLVGGTQMKVADGFTAGVVTDLDRRCDRIAQPDDGVSPRHPLAAGEIAHAEAAVGLLLAQTRGSRVDLGFGRRDRIGVHLRSNCCVDQPPDGLSQGAIDGPQPFDLLGADVLQREVQHQPKLEHVHLGRRVGVAVATAPGVLAGRPRVARRSARPVVYTALHGRWTTGIPTRCGARGEGRRSRPVPGGYAQFPRTPRPAGSTALPARRSRTAAPWPATPPGCRLVRDAHPPRGRRRVPGPAGSGPRREVTAAARPARSATLVACRPADAPAAERARNLRRRAGFR